MTESAGASFNREVAAPRRVVLSAPLAPLLLLSIGCILISGARRQQDMRLSQPLATLPTEYAGRVARDLEVSPEERRIAGMDDYVMRSFGRDSASDFTVFVAYYTQQMQGRAIHSPKNCLPGAGWEIMRQERVPLHTAGMEGQANRVLLANKQLRALVFYWYQGRGRLEANEYKVKWNLLADAALLGRTDEALVRLVIPLPANASIADEGRAAVLADSISSKLVADVAHVLPTRTQSRS